MGRDVVLGIGNRLRGDDAVGSMVIDELRGTVEAELFDGESVPESYIEPIARVKPRRILIVDACAFGGEPGEFRLFDRTALARLAQGSISTHTLPLSLFIELVREQTGAEVWLLGVQPLQLEFGTGLSVPVAQALPQIVRFCREWAAGRTNG